MLPTLLPLVANERPLINVDITLLLNISLWLVLYIFLRLTFWKPMLALISAREQGIDGSRDDAHRLEAEARKIRDKFDESIRKARAEANGERDKVRAEGTRQEAEIQSAVRAEVNAMIESRRAEIAKQRGVVRAELQSLVPSLANEIARKVLSREVGS